LYVAFELSKATWKVAMSSGFGVVPLVRTVASGEWTVLDQALAAARQRFELPATVPVISCYEAGPDGFWIHRALVARGIADRVVDSSSIETARRGRRVKSDRLDALKLVAMLVRVCLGERRVWSEVHVPSAAVEAARHVSRERAALTKDRTRLTNQLRGWLQTVGARWPTRRTPTWWTTVRDGLGAPLSRELQGRLARAVARLALIDTQLAALEAQQAEQVEAAAPSSALAALVALKGVATTSASTLLDEGLVWRDFRNRRQVGGLLGFAPAKYESGTISHDQGIRGAGNARLQAVAIQLAWNWVRWQPDSALTRWYRARFGQGKRARRIGIVALARKLVVALWRYVSADVRPTGAVLKTAA
jgi:transposase